MATYEFWRIIIKIIMNYVHIYKMEIISTFVLTVFI